MKISVYYEDMNEINFTSIEDCIHHPKYDDIKILFLCKCNLVSLPDPLPKNLEKLVCHSNKLTSLPILPKTLTSIHCDHNNITHIPEILPPNLRSLICQFNRIKQIPEILPESIEAMNFSGNLITKLPDIMPPNIQLLFFSNNPILKTLPLSLTRINHYVIIYDSNNNYEYIPPQVRRWLILNNNRRNNNHILKVYNDAQNVHNHNIQSCIRNSIEKITTQPFKINHEKIIEEILEDKILTDECKTAIIEYCKNNNVHTELQLTFEEVLCYVWKTLTQNKYRDEIKTILNSAILDSKCKCFTGRISRLINILNGYSDLVNINITEQEQLGNIILIIKKRLINNNDYSIEKHRELAFQELISRGYDKELIIEWLNYIE